jgi:hypothetical protein
MKLIKERRICKNEDIIVKYVDISFFYEGKFVKEIQR